MHHKNLPCLHLVSFADGKFKKRTNSFKNEAKSIQIFKSINVFDYESLNTSFKLSHGDFIRNNARGFGYWIWKPQIILQTLASIPKGDILIYMDAGFEINSLAKARFFEYIILLLNHESKMLSFSNTHTEYRWTKMDLAKQLDINPDASLMLSSQLAAGVLLFQNNKDNQMLIEEWLNIAIIKNYHFSDDSDSVVPNHPDFIEHRHDASIFSLLRKLRGTEVTHYEVQSYTHFEKIKNRLPLWASRKT